MAEITDDQWEEFIEVVYKVVKKHPETSFVDLMAMKLDSDVYDDFQVFAKNFLKFSAASYQQVIISSMR